MEFKSSIAPLDFIRVLLVHWEVVVMKFPWPFKFRRLRPRVPTTKELTRAAREQTKRDAFFIMYAGRPNCFGVGSTQELAKIAAQKEEA